MFGQLSRSWGRVDCLIIQIILLFLPLRALPNSASFHLETRSRLYWTIVSVVSENMRLRLKIRAMQTLGFSSAPLSGMWPSILTAVFVLCLSGTHALSVAPSEVCRSAATEMVAIRDTLDRILRFFESEPMELNIDGAAAVRMAQGKVWEQELQNFQSFYLRSKEHRIPDTI